jgi:hypothetical protein
MDTFIKLPLGGKGAGFYVSQLIAHIRSTGRDYIIQGQQHVILKKHTKPQSLDVWLRQNFTNREDVAQAVNKVIEDLVLTRLFTEEKFICPDSDKSCKGIKLVIEKAEAVAANYEPPLVLASSADVERQEDDWPCGMV